MIYLVYGPPCGGKSTYVQQHATKDDLICDVDLIYSAISINDAHSFDLTIHQIAIQLKNNLLDIIKNRKGKWNNVYVLSIANTKQKVKQQMQRINADDCIFIDTPREVCLERIKDRPNYFYFLIQEWFATKDL